MPRKSAFKSLPQSKFAIEARILEAGEAVYHTGSIPDLIETLEAFQRVEAVEAARAAASDKQQTENNQSEPERQTKRRVGH